MYNNNGNMIFEAVIVLSSEILKSGSLLRPDLLFEKTLICIVPGIPKLTDFPI
jgi:hypothetical protein